MRRFSEGAAMQVAHIVRDLDGALRRHSDVFGIGPWDIWDFDATTVRDYTYRGKPATHACVIACAWSGDVQIELIQPVSGYSIYDEFLEAHGEGLHHIKLFYADAKSAAEGFAVRGYPVIQSGRYDDDEHYYLDTEKDFGYVLELGNAGRMRPGIRRFPA